jgi:hypothetical protein
MIDLEPAMKSPGTCLKTLKLVLTADVRRPECPGFREPLRFKVRAVRRLLLFKQGFKTATGLSLAIWCLFLTTQATSADVPQHLRAEKKADRVSIYVGDKLFTEYLYRDTEKYPYFYPLNGPLSGESITTLRETNYPHHSSIFFGCDQVNGGNYWQDGLERGRIVAKDTRLVKASGPEIVIEQTCRWERPGAEAPFDDTRRIVITAPTERTRCLDFSVNLKARIPVKILKTNHSLFSARMKPDLSAARGGLLINAEGKKGEKDTAGQHSAWMTARGTRDGMTEGLVLMDHPSNKWYPSPWFTRDYGFLSPTPMYWLPGDELNISQEEAIALSYRVEVYAGEWSQEEIQTEFEKWGKLKPGV